MKPRPILLDTCAALWIVDEALSRQAIDALEEAAAKGVAVLVSPITAWEIGLLFARARLALSTRPLAWFEALLEEGVELAPMTPEILIESSFLPSSPLRDPADRIIAATARALGYRVMTRDGPLLAYARAGWLQAVAC